MYGQPVQVVHRGAWNGATVVEQPTMVPTGTIGHYHRPGARITVGLGQAQKDVPREELERFIWGIHGRAFEMAELVPQVAGTWAALDRLRDEAKARVDAQVQADLRRVSPATISIPFFGVIPSPGSIQVMAVGAANKGKVDETLAPAYNQLADAVSALSFMDGRQDIVNYKAIVPLETILGIGRYVPDPAKVAMVAALRRGFDTSPGRPSEWIARVMGAIRSYVQTTAPAGMRNIFQSSVAAQRGREIVARSLDVNKIAADAGVTVAEATEALKAAGLAGLGEPITLTVLLVVAAIALISGLVAGAIAGGAFAGGKASKVANIEIDGLVGLNAAQLKDLVDKANARMATVAAEPDAAKRKQLADAAAAELKADAAKKEEEFKAQAAKAKAAIKEAGKGFDLSDLLVPGGIAVGSLVILKAVGVL